MNLHFIHHNNYYKVRFEVLTVALLNIQQFWGVTHANRRKFTES